MVIEVNQECQLIKLYHYNYLIDNISGELSVSQSYLREFLAARVYDGAVPCERI